MSTLWVHYNERELIIDFKSNLSEKIDLKRLYKKINETENKIKESQDGKHYYNFEGGSGYVKIAKMLNYNVMTKWSLEFGLTEDDEYFFTHMRLDKNNIIVS